MKVELTDGGHGYSLKELLEILDHNLPHDCFRVLPEDGELREKVSDALWVYKKQGATGTETIDRILALLPANEGTEIGRLEAELAELKAKHEKLISDYAQVIADNAKLSETLAELKRRVLEIDDKAEYFDATYGESVSVLAQEIREEN